MSELAEWIVWLPSQQPGAGPVVLYGGGQGQMGRCRQGDEHQSSGRPLSLGILQGTHLALQRAGFRQVQTHLHQPCLAIGQVGTKIHLKTTACVNLMNSGPLALQPKEYGSLQGMARIGLS
jgi:hypothetical protein